MMFDLQPDPVGQLLSEPPRVLCRSLRDREVVEAEHPPLVQLVQRGHRVFRYPPEPGVALAGCAVHEEQRGTGREPRPVFGGEWTRVARAIARYVEWSQQVPPVRLLPASGEVVADGAE